MAKSNNSGLDLCDLLFVLFIGLKLGGIIAWSWWWVFVPFWGGVLFYTIVKTIQSRSE